ncbi:hypothetical protein Q5P01_014773 [Channa striata]|uniref:Uncharacterized protein n=1 Tax=Channa striata TaxID=64152 RepID=A0AA88SH27_CHASR|nr:hypothetical protein Q5P01_014773 [Channa striata]
MGYNNICRRLEGCSAAGFFSPAQQTRFFTDVLAFLFRKEKKSNSGKKLIRIQRLVRNDVFILQFAQSLLNRHGQDPTKCQYMQQKLQQVGRLLLCLRKDFSIHNVEDAIKPGNFSKVVQCVRKVAGYDEDQHVYRTPSLTLKLGHTLKKISDNIQCWALVAENECLIKSTEIFKKLYKSKWSELVKSAESAFWTLKEEATTKNYAQLAQVTLAQIVVFNQAKQNSMTMWPWDYQKSSKCSARTFAELNSWGKGAESMVDALLLLIIKRSQCSVIDKNIFLFVRPNSMSHYKGAGLFARLRSTQLRKHVATLSQVLNLKNNELDQIADFMGHDIRVHRDFYRLPVPTTQLAEILELLLSMEKGQLSSIQGKSLDEIEIEGEILSSDVENGVSERESDDDSSAHTTLSECGSTQPVDAPSDTSVTDHDNEARGLDVAEAKNSRSAPRRAWSKAEVSAVMRHFRGHILKGKVATKNECRQCKLAEGAALEGRTLQNIRDFVRTRGKTLKRQSQKHMSYKAALLRPPQC